MAKRRVGRYPKAFRKMAVERLKGRDNVLALAKELGIHQRLLYKWRDRLEPMDDGEAPPENSKERELRLQVAQLKRLVADRFRFIPMAEALSRVVPDSNRRMILSIRHGQGMRKILRCWAAARGLAGCAGAARI